MEVPTPPVDTGYEAAQQLVQMLLAKGIFATCDPRSATPPCVLVPPPISSMQRGMCSQWCSFDVFVLAPIASDYFMLLEHLSYWVRHALPNVTDQYPSQYNLSADSPPVPAYRLTLEIGV